MRGYRDNICFRGYLWAWLLCACCGALRSVAAAQEPAAIELEWSAPRECPSRETVLERLSERRAQLTPTSLRAYAKIVRAGAGYRMNLTLDNQGSRAERSLSGSRCDSLAEATAVLIALALEEDTAADVPEAVQPADADPQAPTVLDGVEETSAPKSSPEPESSLPPGPPPEITHEAPSATSSTRSLRLQLWAAARAGFGTFPHQPAWGVQAQLAARFEPLWVAIGATYWPASEQRSESYPNARLRGSGAFGDLSVGFDIPTARVLLSPALSAELGLLDAEALDITGPERARAVWFAVGPSIAASWSVLTDLWLGLELSGLIASHRIAWHVRTPEGDVPAFGAAPLVLRISVRVGYSLR